MFDVLTEDENTALFNRLGSAGDKLDAATGEVLGDDQFGPLIRLWKDCNALRGELTIALAGLYGQAHQEVSTEFDLSGAYGWPA